MRPSVDLAGENDPKGESGEQKRRECPHGMRRASGMGLRYGHRGHAKRQGAESVSSGPLDQVVVQDRGGPHMMFAEGANKNRTNDGPMGVPHSVTESMNQSAQSVREQPA